jgi:hypothetical protein
MGRLLAVGSALAVRQLRRPIEPRRPRADVPIGTRRSAVGRDSGRPPTAGGSDRRGGAIMAELSNCCNDSKVSRLSFIAWIGSIMSMQSEPRERTCDGVAKRQA